MKPKVWKRHYEVEIPEADFLALIRYEREEDDHLCEEIWETTCANDVDYNGCFGNHIFFSLNEGDDDVEEMKSILDIIAAHIKKANEYSG